MIDENNHFRLKNIEMDIGKMEGNIEKILDKFNGPKGITTTLVLHEEKISAIPSPKVLKFYAAAGGGVVSMIMIILYVLSKSVMGN